MDTLEQEQRAQRAKVLKDAEVLQQLISHPGWTVFLSLVEAVGQNFYEQLTMPLKTVDGCVEQEYAKGTLNGLQLASRLPRSKIEESNLLRNPSNEEGQTP